jgi:hypothetical protein
MRWSFPDALFIHPTAAHNPLAAPTRLRGYPCSTLRAATYALLPAIAAPRTCPAECSDGIPPPRPRMLQPSFSPILVPSQVRRRRARGARPAFAAPSERDACPEGPPPAGGEGDEAKQAAPRALWGASPWCAVLATVAEIRAEGPMEAA